ncbi:unnamed protein product, partial [Haemonchus placei]|uniref:ShKT domain-containing protein n=1 Tax=Haemonchus placei TaxID=6290 RepID=A0A0N4X9I4_HAEPC
YRQEFQFVASATACEDKYKSTTCLAFFPAAVEPMGTADRDAACLTVYVKAFAIANCPKTCGYCCMTPEYKCTNKDFPRVKCSSVTPAQCRDPSWRPILAEDCPNVCGFCLEGGCVDTVIECENDPSICRNVDMQDFVKTNCMKTCGYCPSATTAATAATVTTGSFYCANWVRKGFCTNSFYTAADRKKYCAKSCNIC